MKMNYLAVLMTLVILSAGLAFPVTAAYSNDTAVIQSNPVKGLVLDVMGEITSWDLSTIGNNYDDVNISMRIRSNTPWAINVYDALDGGKPSASAGHMSEWNGLTYNTTVGYKNLSYALEVAPAVGDIPVVLSGTQQVFKSGLPTPSGGAGVGGLLYNLSVNQKLRYADTALENAAYRIVVTFVAMNT